ncbi:hypothetical protein B0H14DRAFT_2593406 [Mycena olivaceomarginata]|nr:hypothetical protein B0H14DRAFT_2593406 [Mycena olivaceomarginata]
MCHLLPSALKVSPHPGFTYLSNPRSQKTELAAVKKKTAEHAARGAAPGGHEDEDQRPKGEAGDKKNGFKFNLPVAMGLEDDAEVCEGDCDAKDAKDKPAHLLMKQVLWNCYGLDFRIREREWRQRKKQQAPTRKLL